MGRDEVSDLVVPDLIATPVDVSRLRREISRLDDYLRQQQLRGSDGQPTKLPKTSHLLDELITANNINLLDELTRQNIAAFLADVAGHAPVVHISFASDPSAAFLAKIVGWFRQNIHPGVLVQVGLQPTIAAGCTVRTPNQYFDLSLRRHLERSQPHLFEAMAAQAQPQPVEAVAQVTDTQGGA